MALFKAHLPYEAAEWDLFRDFVASAVRVDLLSYDMTTTEAGLKILDMWAALIEEIKKPQPDIAALIKRAEDYPLRQEDRDGQ
jgi:hypothetical protein